MRSGRFLPPGITADERGEVTGRASPLSFVVAFKDSSTAFRHRPTCIGVRRQTTHRPLQLPAPATAPNDRRARRRPPGPTKRHTIARTGIGNLTLIASTLTSSRRDGRLVGVALHLRDDHPTLLRQPDAMGAGARRNFDGDARRCLRAPAAPCRSCAEPRDRGAPARLTQAGSARQSSRPGLARRAGRTTRRTATPSRLWQTDSGRSSAG